MHGKPYLRLLIMVVLYLAADVRAHVRNGERFRERHPNLNQFLLMRSTYPNRRWNLAILGWSIVTLLVF